MEAKLVNLILKEWYLVKLMNYEEKLGYKSNAWEKFFISGYQCQVCITVHWTWLIGYCSVLTFDGI